MYHVYVYTIHTLYIPINYCFVYNQHLIAWCNFQLPTILGSRKKFRKTPSPSLRPFKKLSEGSNAYFWNSPVCGAACDVTGTARPINGRDSESLGPMREQLATHGTRYYTLLTAGTEISTMAKGYQEMKGRGGVVGEIKTRTDGKLSLTLHLTSEVLTHTQQKYYFET